MPAWIDQLLQKRQRFAPLVLLIGAIAIGGTLAKHVPQEQNVALRLPSPQSITEVRLSYSQEGDVVREKILRFEHGAPTPIRDHVEMARGRYTLTVDVLHGERGTSFERNIEVGEASTIFVNAESGS